jgi:predicted Rossmann fold flavoprotein
VFPYSDTSQSIIDCLVKQAEELGIEVWTSCAVEHISKLESGFSLSLASGKAHYCDTLILATGSNREGYRFAKALGHKIVEPIASLFTFKIPDKELHDRSGLSVENVTVWLGKNKKESQSGPILVTHWGFSGPAIIKLSAWQARHLFDKKYQEVLHIDWLPELEGEALSTCFKQQRQDHGKKQVCKRSVVDQIPGRLWAYFCQKSGIKETDTWQSLSEKSIALFIATLKMGTFELVGKSPFKDEFVTCGGVSLKEINFKTMESKVCPGLRVVGEMLDIDGVTGGFNFQNAWTTGYLSGA